MPDKMPHHWYAIYTRFNAEQILNQAFLNYSQQNALNYESFLPFAPINSKVRDNVEMRNKPLFRQYLFVKHDQYAFFKVKNLKGFNYYLGTHERPSIIPDDQMAFIQKVANRQVGVDRVNSKLIEGMPARVCKGPFTGYKGLMLKDSPETLIAVEIKSLQFHVSIKVSSSDVALIG